MTGITIKAIKPSALDKVRATCANRASGRQFANAVRLVLEGKARMINANTVEVESQTVPGKVYRLTKGVKMCTCRQAIDHPDRLCSHRIAAMLLHAVTTAPEPEPAPAPKPVAMYTSPFTGKTMTGLEALQELFA